MTTIPNPWNHINADKVAECDSPFFNKFGGPLAYAQSINAKNKEAELTFNCLPEPFSGNPQSQVCCLNKNPGEPDMCFADNKEFEQATLKNLALKQETSYGCKIDRGSDVTIVSTSSVSEAGIGHFAYYLALYGGICTFFFAQLVSAVSPIEEKVLPTINYK